MKRTIEITVSPIGEVSIDALGFKGCDQATKFLEEALGVIAKKVKKPQYQQQGVDLNQKRVGR